MCGYMHSFLFYASPVVYEGALVVGLGEDILMSIKWQFSRSSNIDSLCLVL